MNKHLKWLGTGLITLGSLMGLEYLIMHTTYGPITFLGISFLGLSYVFGMCLHKGK